MNSLSFLALGKKINDNYFLLSLGSLSPIHSIIPFFFFFLKFLHKKQRNIPQTYNIVDCVQVVNARLLLKDVFEFAIKLYNTQL